MRSRSLMRCGFFQDRIADHTDVRSLQTMNNPMIDINRREHPPLDGNEMLELFLPAKMPSRKLQQKYHRTQYFKDLSAAVLKEYKTCVLCG
jgi:hypothetical protein